MLNQDDDQGINARKDNSQAGMAEVFSDYTAQ